MEDIPAITGHRTDGRWRRRLLHMAQYFTAYRIDHILGFFRIWEIPGDCTTGVDTHSGGSHTWGHLKPQPVSVASVTVAPIACCGASSPLIMIAGILGHFRPSVPISRHELESRGMWDLERLTQPYIRCHLLNEIFGKMATEVRRGGEEEKGPSGVGGGAKRLTVGKGGGRGPNWPCPSVPCLSLR